MLTVRPIRVPKIADARLRFVQFLREVYELAAQFRKNVAETGGVPSRM